MKPTLLLPILLILLQTVSATSESDRLLDGCSDGCIACSRNTGSCTRCDDDYYLIAGVCYAPFVYKDMIYIKADHFLLFDIDRNGTDVAVIVIFAILAFVVYMGSLFLMQKQDWKELVPEATKEPVKTLDGKEHAKVPTPKGEHVVELGEIEARQTPTPKSATPGSPAKNSQLGSHRSKKTVQEEDEEANLESSKVRENEMDEDEDEAPYYPTKKEMATRNQKDHINEEEEEEDADQVDIQVHDGENNDEDEQRTAQETPSPKTDLHSSPTSSKKKTANKRKGSNHSDADYEDDNRPQVQSNAKNNQHRGNEGEDEEEEFESARSGNGNAHEDEEEEEEEEQEDVMDLNDLGLDNGERKH